MKLMITGLVILVSAFCTKAKPGESYILTGNEKSISEIIKADMEQYPELYKGESLSSYTLRFKSENKIGKKKLSAGDQLYFPETLASIQAEKKPKAEAKREEKNPPEISSIVKTIMQTEEGEHTVQDMKVYKVGYIEAGDTYFHVYRTKVKGEGYRVLIFDNSQTYLGYYATEAKPVRIDGNYIQLGNSSSVLGILIGNYGPFRKVEIGLSNSRSTLMFILSSKYYDGYERFEYRKWKAAASYESYLSCGGLSRFVYYDKDNQQVLREWTGGSLEFAPIVYFSQEDRRYLDTVIK